MQVGKKTTKGSKTLWMNQRPRLPTFWADMKLMLKIKYGLTRTGKITTVEERILYKLCQKG
jgi:hypothetical protein